MNGQRRRRRVPDEEWENHKEIIQRLYLTKGMSLEEVKEAMQRDYDFSARCVIPRLHKICTATFHAKWYKAKPNTKHDSAKNGGFKRMLQVTNGQ